jgi:RNA polymerase sigma-70 factor (ECF subfamily)
MDERAQAIERLYRERYVAFRNAVATVTGGYESARDAVQEGFARAFRSRAQFRGEGAIEAWVWKIVLRAAFELWRDDHRASPTPVPEPALVEPERDPVLAAALRGLPPRRRLVVFLRFFADLSYAEIGEVCGIEVGTVSATLAQAERALAQTLSEEGVRR